MKPGLVSFPVAAIVPAFEVPGQQSRGAWEQDRRLRITGKSRISVTPLELQITVKDRRTVAKFRQDYKADALAVPSRKTLELTRTGDRWLIVKESQRASRTQALRRRVERLAQRQVQQQPRPAAALLHAGLQQLQQDPGRMGARAAQRGRQGARQAHPAQGPVLSALDRRGRHHGRDLRRSRRRRAQRPDQAPVLDPRGQRMEDFFEGIIG